MSLKFKQNADGSWDGYRVIENQPAKPRPGKATMPVTSESRESETRQPGRPRKEKETEEGGS